jgi:ubiquitin-protein ligase
MQRGAKREVIDLDPDEGAPAKKVKQEPVISSAAIMAPLAIRRLQKELKDLQAVNTKTGVLVCREQLQIEFELVNEDKLDVWRAKWFYDMADSEDATKTQSTLAKQLKDRNLAYIEFRIVFPSSYPSEAPFVYNYYPRLKGSYIFSQGGLCAQTLSSEYGWSCASRASALMTAVRSLLENAGCRLQTLESGDCGGKEKTLLTPFTEEGARKDFNSISRIHNTGWHGSAGKS